MVDDLAVDADATDRRDPALVRSYHPAAVSARYALGRQRLRVQRRCGAGDREAGGGDAAKRDEFGHVASAESPRPAPDDASANAVDGERVVALGQSAATGPPPLMERRVIQTSGIMTIESMPNSQNRSSAAKVEAWLTA